MYFFSDEHRLGRILHQTVDEISLTVDDLLIKLECGTNILSSNRVELERNSDRTLWFDQRWVDSSAIHDILGKKILGIRQDKLDELILILECGSQLIFLTSKNKLSRNDSDDDSLSLDDTLMIDFSYRDYTGL